MARRRLADAEIAARCACSAPPDQPEQHRRPCPIAARYYNRRTISDHERAKQRTAAEVAAAFRRGLAYLMAGGRPHVEGPTLAE